MEHVNNILYEVCNTVGIDQLAQNSPNAADMVLFLLGLQEQ